MTLQSNSYTILSYNAQTVTYKFMYIGHPNILRLEHHKIDNSRKFCKIDSCLFYSGQNETVLFATFCSSLVFSKWAAIHKLSKKKNKSSLETHKMAIWDWNQHNFVPKLIFNIGNFEKAAFSNSSQEPSYSPTYTYTHTAISKEIST